jgi:enterochelin esterase-like enzyme
MQLETRTGVMVQTVEIPSEFLERNVTVNFYIPLLQPAQELPLLLINDGQDLVTMGFENILNNLLNQGLIHPVFCVGIHCGEDRKNEYGMLSSVDFKGRGAKAPLYRRFVFEELMPYIYSQYAGFGFKDKAYAGFSLGGLSALDLVWNHPDVFTIAGVFSGSLWWRAKDKSQKDFSEANDRLMQKQIRQGSYHAKLKFFFECGELDESEDRNNNGVIDSIDDTIDVIRELHNKGYLEGKDIYYLQLADGRHDVPTWARAWPAFLQWGWGK